MTKYAMVIDLNKCVGCSACQIACKVENTVGTGHFYSSHEIVENGTFPKVIYKYIPTMCNHCDNAPCVAACPVGALAKQDGLSILDASQCIGCGACAAACPYGFAMKREKAAYAAYSDTAEVIAKCTSSGAETAKEAGASVPYANLSAVAEDELMDESVSEKCNFCQQRRAKGEDPYCVHMCPAQARVWGDVEDEGSEAAKLIADNDVSVSHPEYGTSPSVFYIGSYR